MLADLHSHSYYSDGVHPPGEVIKRAKEAGCNLISLTDHDTTDGLAEAKNVAKELEIDIVSGVEISTTWNNMTIHVVALGIDEHNAQLQELLQHNQHLRRERAIKMAQGLEAAGISNAFAETQQLVQKDMITRTHFARMLIQRGICRDMSSVFKRYLTGKKPGGVGVSWMSLQEVIRTIHQSGGVAIIAHPLRYRMTHTKIKRMFSEFKALGGDGVEVITGSSSVSDIDLVLQWSKDYNLSQSSGSDFHGDNEYIQVGKLKDITLPNPIYDKL